MYLNLFGSDRGNQWGYLSEKKSFGENIITKSSKTLAITTQSIDLKKIKKTALLLGNQGRFLNNENFELSANLSNKLLNITIPNIGTIKILDPIQHIQIANSDIALSQALTKKENTLILYNLNPSYRYQQGKLRDQNQKEL
ncbi:MAG: hypothetical protein Q4B28_03870 [bacterium]|nr:hypothetical protein [bacterium]